MAKGWWGIEGMGKGRWGIEIASQFMSMLPYLATILVLVLISRDKTKIRLNAPQCIGKVFHAAH